MCLCDPEQVLQEARRGDAEEFAWIDSGEQLEKPQRVCVQTESGVYWEQIPPLLSAQFWLRRTLEGDDLNLVFFAQSCLWNDLAPPPEMIFSKLKDGSLIYLLQIFAELHLYNENYWWIENYWLLKLNCRIIPCLHTLCSYQIRRKKNYHRFLEALETLYPDSRPEKKFDGFELSASEAFSERFHRLLSVWLFFSSIWNLNEQNCGW